LKREREEQLDDLLSPLSASRSNALIGIEETLITNGWQRYIFKSEGRFLGFRYEKHNVPYTIDIRAFFTRESFSVLKTKFPKTLRDSAAVAEYDPTMDDNGALNLEYRTPYLIKTTRDQLCLEIQSSEQEENLRGNFNELIDLSTEENEISLLLTSNDKKIRFSFDGDELTPRIDYDICFDIEQEVCNVSNCFSYKPFEFIFFFTGRNFTQNKPGGKALATKALSSKPADYEVKPL
jgi:hypothetical protein